MFMTCTNMTSCVGRLVCSVGLVKVFRFFNLPCVLDYSSCFHLYFRSLSILLIHLFLTSMSVSDYHGIRDLPSSGTGERNSGGGTRISERRWRLKDDENTWMKTLICGLIFPGKRWVSREKSAARMRFR